MGCLVCQGKMNGLFSDSTESAIETYAPNNNRRLARCIVRGNGYMNELGLKALINKKQICAECLARAVNTLNALTDIANQEYVPDTYHYEYVHVVDKDGKEITITKKVNDRSGNFEIV